MKSIQTRANVTLFFAEPGEDVPSGLKSLGRLKDLYGMRNYDSFARYLHCKYSTRNKLVNGVFEGNAFRKKYPNWDEDLEKPMLEYGIKGLKRRLKIVSGAHRPRLNLNQLNK